MNKIKINYRILRSLLLLGWLYSLSNVALAGKLTSSDYLEQGKNLIQQGRYFEALSSLEHAQQEAKTPGQKALALGELGLTHYQLHHDAEAEALLRKATAISNSNPHEQARWNAMLGSMMLAQTKSEETQHFFTKATELACNDMELLSGIELQQVEMLPSDGQLTKLKEIQSHLLAIKPSLIRSKYLVQLATKAHEHGEEGKELAFMVLTESKPAANPRLLAEIQGELAQLYEEDHRYDEAYQINQAALEAIKKAEAPEILLELEWRQGRLLRHRQLIPEALAAYQRAVEHIETIRHDIPLQYRNGQSSFRATLEPLYQQMADLLLEQAKGQHGADKTPTLRRARNVIELVKQAELEDFLGGRCAIQPAKSALLEAVEPNTAIIYPIILPDRLELLVSTGNEIEQFSQSVNAKNLQDATNKFVGALRSGQPEVKTYSAPLYNWLIAPLESFLQQRQVKTLVVVPDGILRLIPFAALHDGKGYLVERYALSTSPGLSIIEPSPLQPHQVKSLIVGLSEPGNVIDHLPDSIINEFKNNVVRGRGITQRPRSRALPMADPMQQSSSPNTQSGQNRSLNEANLRNNIKDAFSLPGVLTEVENMRSTLPGTVLLNENFTVDRFRQELLHEPYAIVHIASHLIAGTNSASSFILAHDNIISFDQLDGLLRSGKFAKQPVEMLTLSACQTAEGDDRAPLGLSGLAIKAKVRSALGTLWPVNDEAAPLLMVEFYKALNHPGISKAQALRQAQLALLQNKQLDHPFFWAPYILVGNWL